MTSSVLNPPFLSSTKCATVNVQQFIVPVDNVPEYRYYHNDHSNVQSNQTAVEAEGVSGLGNFYSIGVTYYINEKKITELPLCDRQQ